MENGVSQRTLPISVRLNLDSSLNQPIRRQTRRLQRPQHRARYNGDFALERREALDEVVTELGALLEAKVGETRVGDRMVLWDDFMRMLFYIMRFSAGVLIGFVVEGLGVADEDDCGRHGWVVDVEVCGVDGCKLSRFE